MKTSAPPGGEVHQDKPGPAAPPQRALARGPPENLPGFPIVALGASAGGLDATRQLLSGLPENLGMAFILVQHLDPTHESMLVELLKSHTSMVVQQAADAVPLEPGHLYVIPPGTYLSVAGNILQISQPRPRHGARLPFDFLLLSLADSCAERCIGVILSGTGTDGSIGLKALKDRGGLVIAQDPDEAGYEGMPRSAIMAGVVDQVLTVGAMPAALVEHAGRLAEASGGPPNPTTEAGGLAEIIDLLRTRTTHDFTLYKPGTLQRRIERRMVMAGIAIDDRARYLAFLQADAAELDLLAKDCLINVTSFFRDPKVFGFMESTVVPELVHSASRDHTQDQMGASRSGVVRIWIAGCSTGEETYSLTMLFQECIAATGRNIKLQVFASDVDPGAIATARDGLYPATIEKDVSAARLARFFTREELGYRVLPELRAAVVFTVQDVLADPPFSRIDLVSCRNLMIYLLPSAQAKILSLFHFALRKDGILLLGTAETVANGDGRFATLSKSDRVYRHTTRSRPGEIDFSMTGAGGARLPARPGQSPAPSRGAALAELCRRLVLEAYAPAAVLIDSKLACLYSLGPTDRYLRMAPGLPTHDLLAMARPGTRSKLRAAIHRAGQENARVVVTGGRMSRDGLPPFSIAVQPIHSEGERLLLICFIDEPPRESAGARETLRPAGAPPSSHTAELEQELEATRMELQGAIRELEASGEDQKAVNEEALSAAEEYQSTNEELLTSKEELQSLNEELTALNSQIQEALERQRTTSNDLQNILYSTDVATLFLDAGLNIRFFTPPTRALFNIIAGDIGRPLADLSSLSADSTLMEDIATVLHASSLAEREIEAKGDVWYMRRILPYRTHDDRVEGVVITFTDISERRRNARALEEAKHQAEQANIAKSRFLAAASHDLRQPLQSLKLIQGLLARKVESEAARKLVAMLDPTLNAMSGMLNSLLDINQIDAGTVRADIVSLPIGDLLKRLGDEFALQAQAQGLSLRIVPCGLSIETDPRLLEQMIRNLLANALKYTRRGKVLLGCRRRGDRLSIEICDTGIGIPESEQATIFDEYHQVDNVARERSRGLGLGLSIVRRLATLLGHEVSVRARPGKGSCFAIEVGRAAIPAGDTADAAPPPPARRQIASILIIEDDPELRELLTLLLTTEGHRVVAAPDGNAALDLVARGLARPDLIVSDYNLPGGLDGLQATAALRGRLRRQVPTIILSGDITTATMRSAADQGCLQLNKPVKSQELIDTIQALLPADLPALPDLANPMPEKPPLTGPSVIYVVDDDSQIRETVRLALEEDGHVVEDYASCEAFLEAYTEANRAGGEACLLIDAYLPGMQGLELLQRLRDLGLDLPAIMITGDSDVKMAVQAMKAGAFDFIEKPIGRDELLASVAGALERAHDSGKRLAWHQSAFEQMAGLTARQRQIMDLVLAGHPSKNIARDLGISQRTVENHRASIMKRTGSRSLPALARLAIAAIEAPSIE